MDWQRARLAVLKRRLLREKQWARFLFCYVREDRDRSDAYLAELRMVFNEYYPHPRNGPRGFEPYGESPVSGALKDRLTPGKGS